MKDPRLLPRDKRDPVEEYEEVFLDTDEEAYELSAQDKTIVKRMQLYVAS